MNKYIITDFHVGEGESSFWWTCDGGRIGSGWPLGDEYGGDSGISILLMT